MDQAVSTLRINNLTKAFGTRVLFKEFSVDIPAGVLTAFVGASGCGKSTLLNCIGYLEPYQSGTISFGSQLLTGASPRAIRAFRQNLLGYLFQNYALIEHATVRENLQIIKPSLWHSIDKGSIAAALERVGLAGRQNSPIYELSGGEQQRVALARILLKQPRIILADEPTGALDEKNSHMVVDLLEQLAHDGACVIIATHDSQVENRAHTVLNIEKIGMSY